MSVANPQASPMAPPAPGRLWPRQLLAITRLELRKGWLRGRSLGLVLLAAMPVGLFALRWLIVKARGLEPTLGRVTQQFAEIFQPLILSLVILFGCVAAFSGLIRREILEQTLHYYFLSPVRREVVLAGKLLAAVIAAGAVFGGATVAAWIFNYLPIGAPAFESFAFGGPGLGHLLAYVAVTLLAVMSYGALFLTFGLFFRSPAIPAVMVFGWEWINFLLPPFLKRLSVTHYLRSLCPVPATGGPFAILADTPPPMVAVLCLFGLTAALLVVSAWKLKRTEILYGED